jgi:hypothetical protein
MKNYQIYGNSRASPKVCKNQDMGWKLVSFIDVMKVEDGGQRGVTQPFWLRIVV